MAAQENSGYSCPLLRILTKISILLGLLKFLAQIAADKARVFAQFVATCGPAFRFFRFATLRVNNPIGRNAMDIVVITNSADEFKRALSSLVVDARSLVFDSGEKGLTYWRAEKPRLVFCDTAMPDVSGFRIAKTIANEKGRTATDVYLMSRNITESDALWAKKQGATGVIECSPAAVYEIVSAHHESQPSGASRTGAGGIDIARLNEIDEAVRKILGPVAFVLAEEARSMLIRKNALTADAYAAQLARHIQDAAGRQRFLDQFVDK